MTMCDLWRLIDRTWTYRGIGQSLLLSTLWVSLIGCGGGGTPDPEPKVPSSTAEIKLRLEEVEKLGGGGSALFGIKEGLEQLKKTDEAKATLLLKEFQKLDAQATPAGRKKQARVMIDKL